MRFVYHDGGRKDAGHKGRAGDCVARSIAIASGRPYGEIYAALSDGCRTQRLTRRSTRRQASARNGVNVTRKWFKDYMRSLGFEWVPCMQIGSGCKVHLHDGELPDGRLVVSVSGHYTAVVDGVIHDTHDPQRETVNFRNSPGWETAELKAGERRNQNGIYTVGRRCVYGYWRLNA